MPQVVRDIGGLQFGGHNIELFSRFHDFDPEWLHRWFEDYTLVEGHVLRGALRIVHVDEYPLYFQATRSVARRRSYHHCPSSLDGAHHSALELIRDHGPFTPSSFKKILESRLPEMADRGKKLLYDLYNHGEVARMGRAGNKPLYHSVESLPYELDLSGVSDREAEDWLLRKCLGIYGPFTVKDVAHWVGWTITKTREILSRLLEDQRVREVRVEDDGRIRYVRSEDVASLRGLEEDTEESSFVRILFNDDALLLGCYRRLGEYFGYDWSYPQLGEGVVWRAAILRGREMVGEAVVDMYADSSDFVVKQLIVREECVTSELLSHIRDEFARHAEFQGKVLQMCEAELV